MLRLPVSSLQRLESYRMAAGRWFRLGGSSASCILEDAFNCIRYFSVAGPLASLHTATVTGRLTKPLTVKGIMKDERHNT